MSAERRPARGGVVDVGEDSTAEVTPTVAARHALRRRLSQVASDLERRGHHDEAAIAAWLLAGAA
jgi:hypothetical protein